VSPAGISAPSNAITLTFPGGAGAAVTGCTTAPGVPTHLSATRDGSTVLVQWQPPLTGGAAASYILHVTGAYVGSFPTVGLGLSGTVAPGSYIVSVQALNACGAGAATLPLTVTVP
jgi:hypothetical protein